MPPHTSTNEIIAHILNPSCSNIECAEHILQKEYQQHQKINLSHMNSVWKAEIRVRYLPKNIMELYETDRLTCHFYFDQVFFVCMLSKTLCLVCQIRK